MPQTTSTPQAPATAPSGEPIPHPEGVSNDKFRAAMSRLTAGVTLVTAHDADGGPRGEDVGMTATAFMSVSLDPPLVMVSVRNGSRMDDLLAEQPVWAVSLLSEDQRQIAGRFSMKARLSDRLLFAEIPWTRGAVSGSPLVGGALATLECRTEQRVEAGDHTLVIGRVLKVGLPSEDGAPLTYFKGNYRKLG
ncbi:flavin reductase family protein [Streptomyces sp. H27-C3]|uniref:flavin reductase family protein n=1 Tax=Streptomyces sp. H27-C3 TaxID=3046305 RepID=UPI0024BA2AA9|nr:flavin reductase family protein [Streptomyces sp. H27-C3]MDJ0464932.1 flavin reductase family protein [Streptomyces sp. H27-C3]